MTRKIKFRAWDKREKDFWYFDLLDLLGSDDSDYGLLKEMLGEGLVNGYTGLRDRNGKEVYVGDICKYYDTAPDDQEAFDNSHPEWDAPYDGGWHNVELIGVVEYGKFEACYTVGGTRWWGSKADGDRCEVIGNIHENPELLKEAA